MPTTEGYNGAYTGQQIDAAIAKANAALPAPVGGTEGQVLEKTESGTKWADKPTSTSTTITITASGWSSNSQTITLTGVKTSGQNVHISPKTKADADAWAAAGVWCSEPTTAGQLTFTCETEPTQDINVNVELVEVQS